MSQLPDLGAGADWNSDIVDLKPERASDDAATGKRSWRSRMERRARALFRLGQRQFQRVRAAAKFAALLALVGVILFSPLLLDDLAFRTAYLLRHSEDQIAILRPVMISDQPRLVVSAGTLSMPPALSGKARTGEALAALVKGGSARLALKGPTFHLDLAGAAFDETLWEGAWSNALSPLLSALDDTAFETLTIRDGTLIVRGAGGREERLEQLNADVSVKRKAAVRIKGSVLMRGETIAFDSTFGARIGRRGSAKMPVKAQIQSALFSLSIDGRLDLTGDVMLSAPSTEFSIPNVRSVARWLGHAWPSGPGLKDFQARGTLDWAGDVIAFDKGTFRMDGNEATGTMSLRIKSPRPALAGTLAFRDADLSVYLGGDGAQGSGPHKSLYAQLKSARDITLPMLAAIDADLRLSAETITAGSFAASRSAASATLNNGQLQLNLAEMALGNGAQASGDLSILGTVSVPAYVVDGRIEGVDFAGVTTAVTGIALAKGRGTLSVDARAAGSAGIDLLSRLAGRIAVSAPQGLSAACSLKSVTAAGADPPNGDGERDLCRGSSTPLGTFKADAVLANGIVRLDGVEARAPGGETLRLNGTIDLVTTKLDLTVTAAAAAVAGSTGEGAPPGAAGDAILVRGRPESATVSALPR